MLWSLQASTPLNASLLALRCMSFRGCSIQPFDYANLAARMESLTILCLTACWLKLAANAA